MGFLGLFRLKLFHPEQFEEQLTALTQAISLSKQQISKLSRKQKAWRDSVLLYCVVLYVSYVIYRYNASYSNIGVLALGKLRLSVFISGQLSKQLAAVCLLPAVIAAVGYLINLFFGMLIRSKKRSLRSLLEKHKAKVEELKAVTNFSRTNQILQKFDTKQALELEGQKIAPLELNPAAKKTAPPQSEKIQNPGQQKNLQLTAKILPPTVNVPRATNSAQKKAGKVDSAVRPDPLQPTKTKLTLQDRLLDFIIGSEHNENVENRYALICANCYTHNGLAPPGCKNPVSVTYICRNCGYINGDLSAFQAKQGPAGSGLSLELEVPKESVQLTEEAGPTVSKDIQEGPAESTANQEEK